MAALGLLATGSEYIGGFVGFVLWILVMVWIYNIAKRKGRHAVGWVVLGLFFWVLALIMILLLPSKRTTAGYG